MDLLDSHDEQSENLSDTHMVAMINRLLEHQKMVADLQAELKKGQPRPRRNKSEMRRIVFIAGSDDHISGNLKILDSKHTGAVHKSVHNMTFACSNDEWLEWKGNVVQEDVMKSGVKFHFATGAMRAEESKRVLRRLSEFAQDTAAVATDGLNVAIGYGDGWDKILHCGRLDGVIDTDWFNKALKSSFNCADDTPFISGALRNVEGSIANLRTSSASYSCKFVVRLCFPVDGGLVFGKSIILGVMPHGQINLGEFNQHSNPAAARVDLLHRALDGALYTGDAEWSLHICSCRTLE